MPSSSLFFAEPIHKYEFQIEKYISTYPVTRQLKKFEHILATAIFQNAKSVFKVNDFRIRKNHVLAVMDSIKN